LLSAGYDVVIVDNLSYSRVEIVEKLQQITNKSPIFYPIDIRDRVKLTQVFDNHNIDGVIHFAAAKSV
jgi:UDP-glucose 4-epimerase